MLRSLVTFTALAGLIAIALFSTRVGADGGTGSVEEYIFKNEKWIGKYAITRRSGQFYSIVPWKAPLSEIMEGDAYSAPRIQALMGKPDPKYRDGLRHTLRYVKFENKYHLIFGLDNYITGRSADNMALWNLPEGGKILGDIVGNPVKLRQMICSHAAYVYRAMWHLSAIDQTDAMLKGFERDNCASGTFVRDTLLVLHTWPLTASQKKTITAYCLRRAFKKGKGPLTKACARLLGRIGTKNEDALEFLRNFALEGVADAIRALAHLEDEELKKDLRRKFMKGAEGGKPPRLRFDKVPMAFALAGMGEKIAVDAILSWLAYDSERGRLVYDLRRRHGYYQVFREAPFASDRAWRTLRPLLYEAYHKITVLAREKPELEHVALTAALYLAQRGERIGLPLIVSAAGGRDKKMRNMALMAMGGQSNPFADDAGMGGLHFGRDGLQKRDGEKILKAVRKRFKSITDSRGKDAAYRVILDIQARMRTAGY